MDHCCGLATGEAGCHVFREKDVALPADVSTVQGIGVELDDECLQAFAVFDDDVQLSPGVELVQVDGRNV